MFEITGHVEADTPPQTSAQDAPAIARVFQERMISKGIIGNKPGGNPSKNSKPYFGQVRITRKKEGVSQVIDTGR